MILVRIVYVVICLNAKTRTKIIFFSTHSITLKLSVPFSLVVVVRQFKLGRKPATLQRGRAFF